ncbi:MAG: hypothetical protein LQ338_006860 [Usnochroma carphineum]|nr:MAG: hypothetical protein LQ338_006860 [Usnochroma carphineum]
MGPKGRPSGFEELKIFANPPQSARERFPKPRDTQPPRLAPYRNNLVALSQYYNLLFVASLDRILVYQPVNQEQSLGSPRSTVNLASSNKGLIGYLDPANSHAINQLVVADLGIEEIIVAVCDDGDVVAYTTLSIQKEIEDRVPDPYNTPDFASELRPFFIANVGMSAWGIAVHKEARMIAVSSNSKKIHVFAFALSKSKCSTPEARSDDDEFDIDCLMTLDDQDWRRPTASDMLDPNDRQGNLEIILSSHSANIPNVAFFNPWIAPNTDVYLVSTDIEGVTDLCDVWKRTVILQLTSPFDHFCGWGVAFIDPCFCRDAYSPVELFGTNEVDSSAVVVDISQSARCVPESSKDHFTLRHRDAATFEPADAQDGEAISDDDGDMEDEYDQDFDAVDDLGLEEQFPDEAGAMADDASAEIEENSESGTSSMEEEPAELDDQSQAIINDMTANPDAPISPHAPAIFTEAAVRQAETMIANLPKALREAMQHKLRLGKSVVFPPSTGRLEPRPLPFYVLHTNQHDIRLFHSIKPVTRGTAFVSSIREVVCRSPLHQHLLPQDNWLSRLERLNMVMQIPELGVVVIGDQTGRVALLSMTRSRSQSRKAEDEKVGFRFERFLPLMWQEDSHQRPKVELLGVAVGPTSNHLIKRADGLNDYEHVYGCSRRHGAWKGFEESRRYRLILYYRDHTVLSYEIGRPPRQEPDAFTT